MSTSEVVVISGMMVVTVLLVMGIFRTEVTKAVNNLSRCITGAVTGDVSGCGGGGGAETSQRAAAPSPDTVPGMRNEGVARGLVPVGPGGPGGRGPGGPGGRGPGGPGNPAGGVPPPGGNRLGANVPSGRDKIPPDQRKQMQDRFNRIMKIATPGNDGVESNWDTGARLWNRTTGGGALEDAMDNSEALGDRAFNHGMQSMRDARQKFDAGDVAGYNAAVRDAQKWFGAAGRNYSAANSAKAEMAGQAADEAQFIADNARKFNTALSAVANPVGFATGMAVGKGVQSVAEATLPPGAGRDLLVSVTTAGTTILLTGAMGNPNVGLKTLQDSATTMAVTTTVQNAVMTGAEKGDWSATGQELVIAVITEAVMRAPVMPPKTAGDSRRSLNDVLSVAGETGGQRIKDEFTGQAKADATKLAHDSSAELAKPPVADGIEGAAQGQSHTAKDDGPKTTKDLPPASDDFKQKLENTTRPNADENKGTFNKAGMNEDTGADILRGNQASGETDYFRPGDLNASNQMRNGTAIGKPKDLKANSAPELQGAIPADQTKSKAGTAHREAEAKYAEAQASGDSGRISQAKRNMDEARAHLVAAQANVNKMVAEGKAVVRRDPKTGADILCDPATGTRFVSDHDKAASTASRDGEPVHNYGDAGQGTAAQAQNYANQQHALGKNANSQTHFEQSTSPKELKLPMPDKVLKVPGDGSKPTIIEGKARILNDMRKTKPDMREGPNWHIEAGIAAKGQGTQRTAGTTAGNRAIGGSNTTAKDDKETPRTVLAKQAFRESTRLQGQKQYAVDAKKAAAAQATDKTNVAAAARQQQVDAAVPKDRAQTAASQRQVADAVARQRAAEDRAFANPTPQNAAALDNASKDLRGVLESQTDERGAADTALGGTFGTPSATTLPATSLPTYRITANGTGSPSSTLARFNAWLIRARSNTAHGPVLALWLAPLDAGADPPEPAAERHISQSMMHERVHAHASAPWRSEFERLTALHEGVSQYFTERALDRMATSQTATYPAFAAQTDIASRIARLVGPRTLEMAYFHGDTIGLHAAMGRVMGARSPQEAVVWGRTLFARVGEAMNDGHNEQVVQILATYAGRPPAQVSAPPAADPTPRTR
ncbi:MAG: hypothetical protein NTY02_15775 [Acidobacteria bacterium]|nr:hypothetical protein [Acidobacteriota bacterium]